MFNWVLRLILFKYSNLFDREWGFFIAYWTCGRLHNELCVELYMCAGMCAGSNDCMPVHIRSGGRRSTPVPALLITYMGTVK